MKTIKYIQLFRYLLKEETHNPFTAILVINQIRKLPIEFKDAVWLVMEGLIPNLECHEIMLNDLIEKDNITIIRAILLLDWIRREPAIGVRYMSAERLRAPQTISETDKPKLAEALKRLNGRQSSHPDTVIEQSDIIVE